MSCQNNLIKANFAKPALYFLLDFFKRQFHNSTLKMSDWQTEKNKFLTMDLLEKRKHYKNKDFKKIEDIPTWRQYYQSKALPEKSKLPLNFPIKSDLNDLLSNKISIFEGDITSLEVIYGSSTV